MILFLQFFLFVAVQILRWNERRTENAETVPKKRTNHQKGIAISIIVIIVLDITNMK